MLMGLGSRMQVLNEYTWESGTMTKRKTNVSNIYVAGDVNHRWLW